MTMTRSQQVQAIEILKIVERGLDSLNVPGEKNNWAIGGLSFLIEDFLTEVETETQAGKAGKAGKGKTAVYSEEMYANDAGRERNNKLLEEILAEIRKHGPKADAVGMIDFPY